MLAAGLQLTSVHSLVYTVGTVPSEKHLDGATLAVSCLYAKLS